MALVVICIDCECCIHIFEIRVWRMKGINDDKCELNSF